MTVQEPAPGSGTSPDRRMDGNDADVRYLEQASAALLAIMAAGNAAASRGAGHAVRVVAHDALAVQTHQLSAISECLLAWGRATGTRPRTTGSEELAGLEGSALDRAFVDRLTEHAHASLEAARAEMIAGCSRTARPIAETDIRDQCRQLAVLEQVRPTLAL